ncbi:DUF4916 domain-containing protein [Paenibacillus sp. LjRoot153]|uniref:DUF4916 domain-containing protein n=1 Tax=Paenibacillus sp. LjRoot153 TaxID=3342270 RepID=UPI003ECE28D9
MNWIEESEWNNIQQLLPIVCVDILPINVSEKGEILRVGLILRNTPHEGKKWCTVGGRLLYGESIQNGILRQLKETLGNNIQIKGELESQPLYVAQYSPTIELHEEFDAVDPRKHAIGLTYSLELDGCVEPQNEAIDFQWFSISELRIKQDIGFHQDKVISSCMELLNARGLF